MGNTMTISRLVSKLRMSGFEVLESNSFSVLYRKNKDGKCKFISYIGGIKHVEDIEPYNLKHIKVFYSEERYKLLWKSFVYRG